MAYFKNKFLLRFHAILLRKCEQASFRVENWTNLRVFSDTSRVLVGSVPDRRFEPILLVTFMTQPTTVKEVGTFHVPSTSNPIKCELADGTSERACYICRLCPSSCCP